MLTHEGYEHPGGTDFENGNGLMLPGSLLSDNTVDYSEIQL
jgi:hypothetical protein